MATSPAKEYSDCPIDPAVSVLESQIGLGLRLLQESPFRAVGKLLSTILPCSLLLYACFHTDERGIFFFITYIAVAGYVR